MTRLSHGVEVPIPKTKPYRLAMLRPYQVYVNIGKRKVWIGGSEDAYASLATSRKYEGAYIEYKGKRVVLSIRKFGPGDYRLVRKVGGK